MPGTNYNTIIGKNLGDLDHDNDVDHDDRAVFIAGFGHHLGEPEYNYETDYDYDCATTLVDYQIWLEYFYDFINI